jgi:hypothetical protein
VNRYRGCEGLGRLLAKELPLTEGTLELIKRQITEETIPMKQTWHGHSAFRIDAGEAKILTGPFLSGNPFGNNGWSGYLTGKNWTEGGDR